MMAQNGNLEDPSPKGVQRQSWFERPVERLLVFLGPSKKKAGNIPHTSAALAGSQK